MANAFRTSVRTNDKTIDRAIREIEDAINRIQPSIFQGGSTSTVVMNGGGSGSTSYTFTNPLVDASGSVTFLYNGTHFSIDTTTGLNAQNIALEEGDGILFDETTTTLGGTITASLNASDSFFEFSEKVLLPKAIGISSTNGITFTDGTSAITSINLDGTLVIDTPQDLRDTATPEFIQVVLGTPSLASHAALAGTTLTMTGTTNRITVTGGGQSLMANRTWTFTLPQDIHTAATPIFSTIKLSSLNSGYLPYHSSDSVGLINSPLYTSSSMVGLGTTTLSEIFNLSGNMTQIGDYSIYNADFDSGWDGAGWRIDQGVTSAGSTLEVDDLWVRGTMNVYELIINQIRATNGSIFVSSTAKVKSVVASAPNEIVTFEDPEENNLCPFATNDILLIQSVDIDGTTFVKRIVRKVILVTDSTAELQGISGAPGQSTIIAKGDVMVRIGNTTNTARQDSLYLTSDDSNSPYIDVLDGVASWTDWYGKGKLKGRFGRLTGITSTSFGSLSGFGFWSENVYLEGDCNVAGNLFALTGGIGGNVDNPAMTLNAQGMFIEDRTLISVDDLDNGTYIGNYYLNEDTIWDDADHSFVIVNNNSIFGWKTKSNPDPSLADTYVPSVMFGLYDTGGKIAGFTFDDEHLTSGQLAIIGGDTPLVKVWGDQSTLYNYAQLYYNSNSDWGLKGEYNSNVVFQLGSTNQIAGWAFDNEKLSKTDVRLEASSSFQGLAVKETISSTDYDFVKIGNFSDTTISPYYEDYSRTILGYSSGDLTGHIGKFQYANDVISPNWRYYTTTNYLSFARSSAVYHDTGTGTFYSWKMQGVGSGATSATTAYGYVDKTVSSYIGNTFELSFWGIKGSDYAGADFTYLDVVVGSNSGTIWAQATYFISDFNSWTQKTLTFAVPTGATTMRISFHFKTGTGTTRNSFYLDDVELKLYNKIKTYANLNLFALSNSPKNFLTFTPNGLQLGASSITSEGHNVPRYIGRTTDYASLQLQVGDFYEDTSGEVWVKTSTGYKQLSGSPS